MILVVDPWSDCFLMTKTSFLLCMNSCTACPKYLTKYTAFGGILTNIGCVITDGVVKYRNMQRAVQVRDKLAYQIRSMAVPYVTKAKIKYMSVSGNVLKKIRVGRPEKYFILFFSFYFEMV